MFPRPRLTQWPSAAAPTRALLTLSEGARGGGLLEGKVMRWRGGERVRAVQPFMHVWNSLLRLLTLRIIFIPHVIMKTFTGIILLSDRNCLYNLIFMQVKTGMVVLVLPKSARSDEKVRVRFLHVLYTILRGKGASRLLQLWHGSCVSRETRAVNQMTPSCLAQPVPPAPPWPPRPPRHDILYHTWLTDAIHCHNEMIWRCKHANNHSSGLQMMLNSRNSKQIRSIW